MTSTYMTDDLGIAQEIKPGITIRCRFTSRGSRLARVTKVTKAGNVYVRKHIQKSDRWTGEVRLYECDFMGVHAR